MPNEENANGAKLRREVAPALQPIRLLSSRQSSALTIGGYIFLMAAAAALGGLVWVLSKSGGIIPYEPGPAIKEGSEEFLAGMATYYLAVFIVPVALLVAACLASALGYSMLRSAGTASKEVIPTQDYELLSRLLLTNPETGIDNYIRLSSLTGLTGVFTKVGLSGLPLATISLTLVFSVLSIWGPSFFDLAKLTLGAFLGSYVQRNVSAVAQAGSDVPEAK